MTQSKITVNLVLERRIGSKEDQFYVETTTNTLSPRPGDVLTEAQVNALMAKAKVRPMHINIKLPKE
jgi:hypothetical protein